MPGTRWPERFEPAHLPPILIASLAVCSFWSTAGVEFCAALLLVLSLALHWRRMFWFPIPLLIWVAYVLGVIASILFSPFSENGLSTFNKLWHSGLFLVGLTLAPTVRELDIVSRAFTYSAAVATGLAIVMYMTDQSAYATSLVMGLTTFSSLLAVAGMTSLLQFLRTDHRNRIRQMGELLVCIAISTGVLFTARLAAAAALVVGSGFVLLRMRPAFIPYWAAMLLVIFALSPEALLIKLSWVVGGGQTDRYVLWNGGLNLLWELPPFGFGPGSFPKILPAQVLSGFSYKPPASWHNDFLQMTIESGWITAVLYSCGVGAVNLLTMKRALSHSSGTERSSAVMGAGLLGVLTLIACADSVVSTAVLGVVWWLVLGAVTGYIMRKDGT